MIAQIANLRKDWGMTAQLTPLGRLVEEARARLGFSRREAAKRAGISESRWRQVVLGVQQTSAGDVPANPRASTVIAMADAVQIPRSDALVAAGFDPHGFGQVQASARAGGTGHRGPARVYAQLSVDELVASIYNDSRVPDDRKHELVRIVRQAEADRRRVDDELQSYGRHDSQSGQAAG